jgi:hypothetical protein
MAKVRAFSIEGITCWFPSNDHAPPHFHAKRTGAWEMRVYFLLYEQEMFELKWQKSNKTRISKQDRQRIIEMVISHRNALLQEWETIRP